MHGHNRREKKHLVVGFYFLNLSAKNYRKYTHRSEIVPHSCSHFSYIAQHFSLPDGINFISIGDLKLNSLPKDKNLPW